MIFSRELLLQLYRHMEWADARMWAAIPIANPCDKRLQALLVHIHVVQRAFLKVWEGGEWTAVVRQPESFASIAEVRAWARPYYQEVRAFLDDRPDSTLGEPVIMPWSTQVAEVLGRQPAQTTFGDTCFQVASHTTHHRAQVSVRLRDLGVEPPPVDYIAWVWLDKPDAEWKDV